VSGGAATAADKRPGLDDCIALLVEQQLRGLCVKLAVSLHYGEPQPQLLAEITEMAADAWALRDGSDDS
jgi:hypothetical protein